ncbi:MAG: NADPH2:quinone reductase [Aeromicrobium sp.]|nr:NADPH2:quinone reductase [Aeromicrobium sp.]
MRAATVTEFGGPEVFRIIESPDPTPAASEVVIAVEAADTLWLETFVRSGHGIAYWPMRPPYVPGNGVVGTITSLGAEVDDSWRGRLVAAHTGNEGGYADRVAVPVEVLSPVPDGLDPRAAAALLHDGPTALALADITEISAGDDVLIVGASGGLGIILIQLAAARGARVVALARGPKLARVAALGPDITIDTEAPDWLEQVRAALPNGADVILDNVGGELGEATFALAATGARFSAHGTPAGAFASIDPAEATRRDVTVTGIDRVQMSAEELVRRTDQALAEATRGTIAPVIGQVFALDDAAGAHSAIEGREVFGTTLLIP